MFIFGLCEFVLHTIFKLCHSLKHSLKKKKKKKFKKKNIIKKKKKKKNPQGWFYGKKNWTGEYCRKFVVWGGGGGGGSGVKAQHVGQTRSQSTLKL